MGDRHDDVGRRDVDRDAHVFGETDLRRRVDGGRDIGGATGHVGGAGGGAAGAEGAEGAGEEQVHEGASGTSTAWAHGGPPCVGGIARTLDS